MRARSFIRIAFLIVGGATACASFQIASAAEGPTPNKIELAQGWKLKSASDEKQTGAAISQADFQDTNWRAIQRMPATVLEILQEDDVYPNLYVGKNMAEAVPQDLYKHDWWYRTTFDAPAGHDVYLLEFPGINYRAEIWLNGHLLSDSQHVVGMYVAHEINATQWIAKGQRNVLAVKVTPERLVQDVDGVELADSWFDWLSWKYMGYHGKLKPDSHGISFVPDRNAGIWKPVYLKMSGDVVIDRPYVRSDDVSVPESPTVPERGVSVKLNVYASLQNFSDKGVEGVLRGTISRARKSPIAIEQPVSLKAGESREISFVPTQFPQLVVTNPDLWWPYTMGKPNLYDLRLEFVTAVDKGVSDISKIRFGIRSITQYRDNDNQFPEVGKGGNFYIKVNGRNFLVRGGVYTPDLFYRYDEKRETDILRYVKDLGLNMVRWESKISSEHIIDLADEEGIPLMFGWMCCNQWEMWDQWSTEDHRVADESMLSQISMLRKHASVWIWANGSDGLPPDPILNRYHTILKDLHWQNAVVDTVSSFAKDPNGEPKWNGIHMQGPYSWRPPTYWFCGKYAAARGSCAEQGDNEHIPTFESLKKFIPADKLWPINDTWYFHSGANPGNDILINIQHAVDARYGPSSGAEEFSRKAQLAHYEATRAQFEAFAADGWANHKMTIYWMLNGHWPSFFGNIFDYYLEPGGAYFGAKAALKPLSVVFDAYARSDHGQARVIVANQSPATQKNLRVRVRIYDLDGKIRGDKHAEGIAIEPGGAVEALKLPRFPDISPVFFVRCELLDEKGGVLHENVYWQSQKDDDVGDPKNDGAFGLKPDSWADMTALNTMPKTTLEVSATRSAVAAGREKSITIRLRNSTQHVGFFEHAEVTSAKDGDEILPIEYDNNYVTVFPGETVEIKAKLPASANASWIKLEGYNTAQLSVPVK